MYARVQYNVVVLHFEHSCLRKDSFQTNDWWICYVPVSSSLSASIAAKTQRTTRHGPIVSPPPAAVFPPDLLYRAYLRSAPGLSFDQGLRRGQAQPHRLQRRAHRDRDRDGRDGGRQGLGEVEAGRRREEEAFGDQGQEGRQRWQQGVVWGVRLYKVVGSTQQAPVDNIIVAVYVVAGCFCSCRVWEFHKGPWEGGGGRDSKTT